MLSIFIVAGLNDPALSGELSEAGGRTTGPGVEQSVRQAKSGLSDVLPKRDNNAKIHFCMVMAFGLNDRKDHGTVKEKQYGGKKMSFVIIPDSACSMPAELRIRFNIPAYVNAHVLFPDGTEHDTDLDWKEISADDYFRSMAEKKAIYKTGTASLENSLQIYEKYLMEGKDLIALSLSSALSGNYNLAVKACEILQEKYPERRIYVIDSKRYSAAIAAMIAKADELRAEGKSVDEVAEWLEENKNRYHQMGPMDDLNFLCRTGRINNFKAFFGTLVGVNALGDLNQNGLTDVLGKVKGKPAALKTTIEYVKRTIEEPESQIIFIAHSYRYETAEELKRLVEAEFHPKEIIMTRVDMSCGANIGPGLAAVFYYGKEISENLAEEKKLMEELTK